MLKYLFLLWYCLFIYANNPSLLWSSPICLQIMSLNIFLWIIYQWLLLITMNQIRHILWIDLFYFLIIIVRNLNIFLKNIRLIIPTTRLYNLMLKDLILILNILYSIKNLIFLRRRKRFSLINTCLFLTKFNIIRFILIFDLIKCDGILIKI